MKTSILALLSSFLLTLLSAQTSSYTRADLEKELATITYGMEKYHPNAYHYTDSTEMAAYRKHVLATAPEELNALEAYRELNKYVCLFNDGHTRLWDNQLEKAYVQNGGRYLPFEVQIINGELIIAHDYSNNNHEGQRITAINGIEPKELLAELSGHASRETTTLDHTLLSGNFGRYLWLAYGWEGNFNVAMFDKKSNATSNSFAGITLADKKAAMEKTANEAAVSYRMLDDNVAYLKVAHFEGRPKTFHRKFDEAFAFFNASGAKKLIIDARNHGGGDSRIGADLARYFANSAFKPFAYSTWKATPELKHSFKNAYLPGALHFALPVIKGINPHTKAIYSAADYTNARVEYKQLKPYSGKRAFTGEVFLLMDKNTFSAGTCFAAVVKDHQMATIIGQESGNLANFHADGLIKFDLPVSKLRLQISSSYLVRPSGDETPIPVQPDVLLADTDDALEYALKFASN